MNIISSLMLIVQMYVAVIDATDRKSKADDGKLKTCRDIHPGCKNFMNLCSTMKIVQRKCKETCGLCSKRANAPPLHCEVTPFGCCWDNETVAKGKYKDNCPACVDQYGECKYYRESCGNPKIFKMCPVTCGVKCSQCLDNKYQAPMCSLYKRYKFCDISPNLMEKMCSQTCGFCK